MEHSIRHCSMKHIKQYGEIYARAFSCDPWNDHWKEEDAEVHIGEILESKQSYGLEYLIDCEIVGFILGSSMLFSYGRTFEINDLAVHPDYQGRGIATKLLEKCLEDLKEQGIKDIHLITASEGVLPSFYEKFGFKPEEKVMLMSLETDNKQ